MTADRSRRRLSRGASTVSALATVMPPASGVELLYLASKEHSSYAVEQLVRRDDVTLDQHTRTQRHRHPPSCAHRYLVKPLFQRKTAHHAVPALQHLCHVGR